MVDENNGGAVSGPERGERFIPEQKTTPRPNRVVFIGSAVAIILFAVWAIVFPDTANAVITSVVSWISRTFGWYYILTATVVVIFVVFIAGGRTGRVKLGPAHSKPQFNLFTWSSMLFAAGIGTDIMFFSVSEPVTDYYSPPRGSGENIESARQAVVWTLFHYGITGWAMYALMGMAFGLFAYRYNLPLSIRSALYPVIGKKVNSRIGDSVEIAAVLGTIFGIATSLGIGVVQLNYGLHVMFGIEEGLAAQIGLIALAIIMAIISTVSGVEKGIRRLSEINIILAAGLMLYVLINGKVRFLLDAIVLNIGDFFSRFPGMTLNTFAFDRPDDWLNSWTLFFWAWWVAWAPFVGLFLARISRGRTIRQFVAGVLAIPFMFIVLWISIFGNSALKVVLGGNDTFGDVAMNQPEEAFYSLLQQYPAAPVLVAIATFVGLLFYVTSADSGALVMSNFTSRAKDSQSDGPKWMRVFWAAATGLLTLAMLLVGGVTTLQQATLIIGLPFSLVLYLVMIGLYRALRVERYSSASYFASLPGQLSGRAGRADRQLNWRHRLSRSMSYANANQAEEFITSVAEPAITDVTAELRSNGADAHQGTGTVDGVGVSYVDMRVTFSGEREFKYQVYPVVYDVPSYSVRSQPGDATYFRVEVFSVTGSQGYDLMGYTKEQLITDILDHYERHMEFLHIARDESSATSVAEDAPAPQDW